MSTPKGLTVKQWDDADKPRERLLSHGAKQLSNTELIAILLRSGLQGKNVIDVAREVLALTNNSLTSLSQLDSKRLCNVKGLGLAKATTLMAALELGWRMQGEISDQRKICISDSTKLFNLLMPQLVNLDHEEFWAVHLDNALNLLGRQCISIGGQSETNVDLRILFRGALDSKATHIAVAHNHPSGSLTPSEKDKRLTQRIKEAGTLLGIRLLEHIIIGLTPNGQADYYSFSDDGML